MASTAIAGRLPISCPHLPHMAQAIPAFLYGTAWKKDATADLVYQSLNAGFTGIDTANQPRHYQEHLVGSGMRRALQEGKIERSKVYLQTKFSPVAGQDPANIPYNATDPLSKQVQQSVISSLHHLRAAGDRFDDVDGSYIDTLVLHSPMPTMAETMEVWKTLETFVPGKIWNLGISNCDLSVLEVSMKTPRSSRPLSRIDSTQQPILTAVYESSAAINPLSTKAFGH